MNAGTAMNRWDRMDSWDHQRYCDAVGAEIDRFAAAVRDADTETPVVTCPGWTIAQLLVHMGQIHRWVEVMVRELAPQRYRKGDIELNLPDRAADYPRWLAEGGGPLVATLRAADPDAPMWVWGADPHVRWWSRRMLHETTIHRADAELALGRTPDIAADVAVDGVAEFFANLSGAAAFSPGIGKLRGTGETIALSASDVGVSWLVTLGPDGPAARPGEAADVAAASAAVRGSAADVVLFAWGRRGTGDPRLETSGDAALLTWWLEHAAVG